MSNALPADESKFPNLSQPHPFSVYDMVTMERIGDPRPSPNGDWIVFTRQNWDAETNQKTTNLWLVSIDGKVTRYWVRPTGKRGRDGGDGG